MRELWRKGLRVALAVLAVAGVGAMAACGGDDDDDNAYDFNGTWSMNSLIVQSNIPGYPPGVGGTDIVKISQSGSSIAIGIAGVPLQNGTCNPEAGTFTAAGTVDGMVITTTGTAVDDDTISGEWVIVGGPYLARATYTAQLLTRSLAAGAEPRKPGLAAAVLQSLQ